MDVVRVSSELTEYTEHEFGVDCGGVKEAQAVLACLNEIVREAFEGVHDG